MASDPSGVGDAGEWSHLDDDAPFVRPGEWDQREPSSDLSGSCAKRVKSLSRRPGQNLAVHSTT
jgi:hypothetical protein